MSQVVRTLFFTKMHALGNDFVVINALSKSVELSAQEIVQLADRHRGVGFDQMLVLRPGENAEFYCQIFNADGSEAEQCGNGMRAVARFIHEQKCSLELAFRIQTKGGVYPVVIHDLNRIEVNMGVPQIKEQLKEFNFPPPAPLKNCFMSVMSLGNPHAVILFPDIKNIEAELIAKQVHAHPYFSHGINLGLMQVLSPSHILLRTVERGVGETHACGSNACAAAVAGISNGWLNGTVEVEFRYGSLFINWEGEGMPIKMTGPATHVFDAELTL